MTWTARARTTPLALGALALIRCTSPAPPPVAPAAPPPAVAPPPVVEPAPPPRRADVAEPPEDRPNLSREDWLARHAEQLRAPERKRAGIVVLGDSIADGWARSRSFEKQWKSERPLNLALPGDQTQQVSWRIEQGALDGLAPRLVVIGVGIENLIAGFTPPETASGVRAVLSRVRDRLPHSAVLVLAPLPAGSAGADPLRAQVEALNRELAALAEPERVIVADVGGMFVEADGSISPAVMSDGMHPTELGYQALTTATSLVAVQLLRSSAR